MTFTKAAQYVEPSINSKLSNLKVLFKKPFVVPDTVEVERINKAASRRGSRRGRIIDTHIKNGTLDRVFITIADGIPIVTACKENGILYITFNRWCCDFPLIRDRLEKAKALGARAKQEKNLAQGIKPKQKELPLDEFYFDINNLNREQIEAKYGTGSVMLEYAKRSNPNFQ